jgi:hypothetical protein
MGEVDAQDGCAKMAGNAVDIDEDDDDDNVKLSSGERPAHSAIQAPELSAIDHDDEAETAEENKFWKNCLTEDSDEAENCDADDDGAIRARSYKNWASEVPNAKACGNDGDDEAASSSNEVARNSGVRFC